MSGNPSQDIERFTSYLNDMRQPLRRFLKGEKLLKKNIDVVQQRMKAVQRLFEKLQSRADAIRRGEAPEPVKLSASDVVLLSFLYIYPEKYPGVFKMSGDLAKLAERLRYGMGYKLPEAQVDVAERTRIQRILSKIVHARDKDTYYAMYPRDDQSAARVYDFLADDPSGEKRAALYRLLARKGEYGWHLDPTEAELYDYMVGNTPERRKRVEAIAAIFAKTLYNNPL